MLVLIPQGLFMLRLRAPWMLPVIAAVVVVGCSDKQGQASKTPSDPSDSPVPAPQPMGVPAPGQAPSYPQPSPPFWQGGVQPELATREDAEKALVAAEAELSGVLDGSVDALGDARCVRSCKALASMRRAVERLCELTGEADERCENAKSRLSTSEKKVADAGCSCP